MTKATRFEEQRPRLLALAYRMLGSVADAEDIVQETYLRWHGTDEDTIEDHGAWLATVCTRLSIDRLRTAYRRREHYIGTWLPDPVVGAPGEDAGSDADLADSLSMAFLLLLERLSPLERAAFLLHDAFDYDYSEVAAILDRSRTACRQLVARARRHLRDRPRFAAVPNQAEALLDRFLKAARHGDLASLEKLLSDDVEVRTDSGGKVPAARNVIAGRAHVARYLVGIATKESTLQVAPASINGDPGAILRRDGRIVGTVAFYLDEEGQVRQIFLVLNPDKVPPEEPTGRRR